MLKIKRDESLEFSQIYIYFAEGRGVIPKVLARKIYQNWRVGTLVILTGRKTLGIEKVVVRDNRDLSRCDLLPMGEATSVYEMLEQMAESADSGDPRREIVGSILIEPWSDNTVEQANFVAEVLDDCTVGNWRELPVTAVCHSLHAYRCVGTLLKKGFNLRGVIATPYVGDMGQFPSMPHMAFPEAIYQCMESSRIRKYVKHNLMLEIDGFPENIREVINRCLNNEPVCHLAR